MRRENLWERGARESRRGRCARRRRTMKSRCWRSTARRGHVVSFDEWRQLPPDERAAACTVSGSTALAPGWAATHLDAALFRAAEMLEAEPGSSERKPRNRRDQRPAGGRETRRAAGLSMAARGSKSRSRRCACKRPGMPACSGSPRRRRPRHRPPRRPTAPARQQRRRSTREQISPCSWARRDADRST